MLSDILFRGFTAPVSESLGVPKANLIADIDGYGAQLRSIGFHDVRIGTTPPTTASAVFGATSLPGLRRNGARGGLKFRNSIGPALVCRAISAWFGTAVKAYLLVSARKPGN